MYDDMGLGLGFWVMFTIIGGMWVIGKALKTSAGKQVGQGLVTHVLKSFKS